MEKDDFKKIFFELLNDDEEFQRKLAEFILDAVAKKFDEHLTPAEEPPKSEEIPAAIELENLSAERDKLQAERDKLQAELESMRRDKNSVVAERDKLRGELESMRRDKNSVVAERDKLRGELAELQTQLDERFADGWALYKTFLMLDDEERENSGLYFDNFKEFICSGAQQKRLEGVWEAALDCKRGGKFDDAKIFWEIFKYCVGLVNAAQGTQVISILNTQIGERYDTTNHSTSGTDSPTQGVVQEIILAGYQNNLSRKIIRKSNVRLR